jgi:DNA polymerase-3 subunit alpha
MNLEEPVAFKVKVTHTEMFTRISVLKVLSLKDAKKESKKVKTTVVEKPQEPLHVSIRLNDSTKELEELYTLVRRHPGRRTLKLCIVSKLQNVLIDSAIGVDNTILEELQKLEYINIL